MYLQYAGANRINILNIQIQRQQLRNPLLQFDIKCGVERTKNMGLCHKESGALLTHFITEHISYFYRHNYSRRQHSCGRCVCVYKSLKGEKEKNAAAQKKSCFICLVFFWFFFFKILLSCIKFYLARLVVRKLLTVIPELKKKTKNKMKTGGRWRRIVKIQTSETTKKKKKNKEFSSVFVFFVL